MADKKPLLVELQETIACSKGSTIEGFLRLLDEAYYAADVNHMELVQGVRKVTDPAVAIDLLGFENPRKLNLVGLETARLLQNYLDSTHSLRKRINHLVTGAMPELKDSWDRWNKKDKLRPANAFVTGLRVYVHHSRQPAQTSTFNLWPRSDGGTDFSSMISISRLEIGKARNWSTPAKRYMESQPTDKILLDQLVLDHFPLVENLAQWVVRSIRQTYKDELYEFEALRKQYALEYERTWGARSSGDAASDAVG